jgi:hypothetical protein
LDACIKKEQVFLGEGRWSWLGGFSLFFRDLSRFALQLIQLLCNGQNFPLIGKLTKTQYTMLKKYGIRKNKYSWERGAGLGWVVAASFSVICPDLHYNCFNSM